MKLKNSHSTVAFPGADSAALSLIFLLISCESNFILVQSTVPALFLCLNKLFPNFDLICIVFMYFYQL